MSPPPVKVAFFSVVPSPYQRDLFAALARRTELEVSIFYLEAAAPDSPWPEKPLASYEQILPGKWFALGTARVHWNWQLPNLREFDVVVMNTLMSVTAQRLMRGPLRSRQWVFWGERLRPRMKSMRQRFHDFLSAPLHRTSAIAGIGSLARDDYAARFPEPLHFCIPYHCELAPFMNAPRRRENENDIVFLFCGQMIARKGVDILLEAFRSAATKFPSARLLLVGREADLPAMLEGMPEPARSHVTYAGFQAPDALPEFFAKADVFVLPSRYDGWGVVVNQALGAGLPIVCSDAVGAAHDLVEDGINGLKFPSGNANALARAMERFAAEPGLCENWGAASRAKAAEWLPERGAEKWVNAIQSVLA